MLFNSLQFMLFFPLVAACYFFCTHRVHNNTVSRVLLLCASLFFYACWNYSYLALILLSVTVTWASGILMERFARQKKAIIALSLFINLALLFFFKYFNFFSELANDAAHLLKINGSIGKTSVLLPVGISFYTFQALGYSIDVYRGTVKAERNFITYALFVTFFPQLVAGPIERTANLLPQFKTDHTFDYTRVTDGFKLAAWGMFKKVVIADRLAVYVNGVYGNVGEATGTALLIATVFFAFQILCDFSGYSDIAIGCAKVLGFKLMRNFRAPYFARSIADFWRRWHISLSTWFKDYVFIPLGGSRVKPMRRYFNLMITFLVSGLWHGASLNFVAWGALHGAYQVVGIAAKPFREKLAKAVGLIKEVRDVANDERGATSTGDTSSTETASKDDADSNTDGTTGDCSPKDDADFGTDGATRLYRVLQTLCTFVLVCIAWVFFRANGIKDALNILQKMLFCGREIAEFAWNVWQHGPFGQYAGFDAKPGSAWAEGRTILLFLNRSGVGIGGMYANIALIALLLCAEWLTRTERGAARLRSLPRWVRWVGYVALFYATFATAFYNKAAMLSAQDFIYFQF